MSLNPVPAPQRRWFRLPYAARVGSAWARLTAVELPRDRWRTAILVAIVAIPIAFNAVSLWTEVTLAIPNVNDDAFHHLMVRSASEAIARGENPLDSWGPEMDLGAPRFLFYQNLPALFVIALDRLTFGLVGLMNLLNITRYVLMLALPLTVYWSMRRLEFTAIAAAGAAAASSLLSTEGLYGIEYDSFVWRGWGMFTQLVAIHLSFITIACLWHLARTGRGLVRAVVAASALVVSHLLYAEMMVITGTVVFLVGVQPRDLPRRVWQFALAGLLIGVVTSYLWLTFLLNRPYIGESPYDASFKLDAFGVRTTLGWLVRGQLFDNNRLPVFTAAIALGIASLLLVRQRQRFLALALFLVWLALYCGRSIWGPVADHVPSGSMLLFHRFIGSFQIGGILLLGMGFEAIWRVVSLLPRRAALLGGLAACALLLAPAIIERHGYYEPNARWMRETAAAYESDVEARAIIDTLRSLPPGRVYAGLRSNWGESMRIDQVPMYRVLVQEGLEIVSVPLPSINLNSDLQFHFNDRDPVYYELFDVRYVFAPRGLVLPDFLTPLATTPRYALYRAPSSGAAMFASSTVRRSMPDKFALFYANREWLLGASMPARAFIRWDYPSLDQLVPGAAVPRCTNGTIANEQREPARVAFDTSCPTGSTVVIKTTYHPNWRVTVDGVERTTFMASPSFIGVDVPAGDHRVIAEYHSSSLRTVLIAIGIASLVVFVVVRRYAPRVWRRRAAARTDAPPAPVE